MRPKFSAAVSLDKMTTQHNLLTLLPSLTSHPLLLMFIPLTHRATSSTQATANTINTAHNQVLFGPMLLLHSEATAVATKPATNPATDVDIERAARKIELYLGKGLSF